MALHMDGARIWNAAAALGVPFREFTTDAGVDVVSFGGTKNGLLGAEAIVVVDPARVEGMPYLRKLDMQFASKMRFASAQLLAIFDDELGFPVRLRTPTRWRPGCDGGGRLARRGPVLHPADRGERRVRDPSARETADGSVPACGSTTGIAQPGRCGGCAPATRLRPTSTRSFTAIRDEFGR